MANQSTHADALRLIVDAYAAFRDAERLPEPKGAPNIPLARARNALHDRINEARELLGMDLLIG